MMPLARSYSEAKAQVEHLVERFDRNLDVYKQADYKETQVRVEFIDPLFEALGWDVRNTKGYAEQYKDVIHEDAIKVSGTTRAPDYSFRVGGTRKFFLEAKKPSVSVHGDVGPAYQLRRYAWSAKLPLSILTDFEELAVYDCRKRPKPADKAGVARIQYLTFDQYLDRFDDIYGVFARESVLQGSFDRYVQDTKGKRGTSEVDAEFLKEIEGWREALARNIALRNPALSVHELNFAVQRTIDRIIFLRMCEDRGIEEYGRLLALTGGPHIYPRLADTLYRQADAKYNSGLFDFQADTLTKMLAVDDKVIKPILAGLYYPECPYEFSVLPAEVLGQVYEQFLGKVIRLTSAHRAKVEEKPEVKKAGGVYYTPAYIVDYIVEQTVGKLVEDKSPRQLRGTRGKPPLRVLDPACGSGSFLLGAYQYLLDHYRRWYEAHDPEKHTQGKQPALYQGPGGEWRLTTSEKKLILLDHIYGVDIDRQAVEVTKLSLLLQVLEGETDETLGQQLSLWRERALPDLDGNIKCGNSLIGPDYFESRLLSDEEEMRRVNPLDWEVEFSAAMVVGGFDAVIGNPPYGALVTTEDKTYLRNAFESVVGKFDSYGFFIERGLWLLRNGGQLGYITPHTWLTIIEAESLRRLVLNRAKISELDRLPTKVFQNATVNTVLVFLEREERAKTRNENVIRALLFARDAHLEAISVDAARENQFSQGDWFYAEASMFNIDISAEEQILLRRIQNENIALRNFCDFCVGVQAYDRYTGQDRSTIESRAYHAKYKKDETYMRELNGKDISRYCYYWPGDHWISYGPWLAHPRKPHFFKGKRILVREITATGLHSICATVVEEDFINYKTILNIVLTGKSRELGYDILHMLGVINSALMSWYFPRASNKLVTKTFPRISILDLKRFPFRVINFDDPTDAARHDQMVALVERMLDLHKKLAAATIPADKTLYQRQIEATDRQIDALVYELYGLTEEEIAIVEGK